MEYRRATSDGEMGGVDLGRCRPICVNRPWQGPSDSSVKRTAE